MTSDRNRLRGAKGDRADSEGGPAVYRSPVLLNFLYVCYESLTGVSNPIRQRLATKQEWPKDGDALTSAISQDTFKAALPFADTSAMARFLNGHLPEGTEQEWKVKAEDIGCIAFFPTREEAAAAGFDMPGYKKGPRRGGGGGGGGGGSGGPDDDDSPGGGEGGEEEEEEQDEEESGEDEEMQDEEEGDDRSSKYDSDGYEKYDRQKGFKQQRMESRKKKPKKPKQWRGRYGGLDKFNQGGGRGNRNTDRYF